MQWARLGWIIGSSRAAGKNASLTKKQHFLHMILADFDAKKKRWELAGKETKTKTGITIINKSVEIGQTNKTCAIAGSVEYYTGLGSESTLLSHHRHQPPGLLLLLVRNGKRNDAAAATPKNQVLKHPARCLSRGNLQPQPTLRKFQTRKQAKN